MTRDLDAHCKLHWVLVSRQGLGIWMSFMTWFRLTTHEVVSDCDLGKVSVANRTRPGYLSRVPRVVPPSGVPLYNP